MGQTVPLRVLVAACSRCPEALPAPPKLQVGSQRPGVSAAPLILKISLILHCLNFDRLRGLSPVSLNLPIWVSFPIYRPQISASLRYLSDHVVSSFVLLVVPSF